MNDPWAVVAGALIGALGAQISILLTEWARDYRSRRLDRKRVALLQNMLRDKRFEWRKLSTLSHVIGVDEETAQRLLIEAGARASEDGTQLWGLISRHPLPDVE